MTNIAIALLKLPNNKIVFQRRDNNARVSRGLLGLFGGHIEQNEDHGAAIVRELKEETDLNTDNLKYISAFTLPTTDGPDKERNYYLYQMNIPNMNFKIFEGVRSEAYSKEDALNRDDLTNSARYSLENFT
jgi:8-oxo-dGTP pyrophosphatase MutT (NUDIX family)